MAEATESKTVSGDPALVPLTTEPLAERLERLERSIAGLQSAEAIEQRVLARLQSRPGGNGSPPLGLAATGSPGSGSLIPASVLRTVLPAVAAGTSTLNSGFWGGFGLLGEIRLMYRMYVDPRYRLSSLGQFGIPIVLGLIVVNEIFTGSLLVIGPFLRPVILLVLAIVLYKLLARDATRYAEVLAYIARYGG